MDCDNNRKWLDMTSLKYYSHLELFIVHFVFDKAVRAKFISGLTLLVIFLLGIWVADNLVWLKCIQSDLKNNCSFKNMIKTSVAAYFCCCGLIISLECYWLKLWFWVPNRDKDSGDVSGSFACVRGVDLDTWHFLWLEWKWWQFWGLFLNNKILVPETSLRVLQLTYKMSMFCWHLVTKYGLTTPRFNCIFKWWPNGIDLSNPTRLNGYWIKDYLRMTE